MARQDQTIAKYGDWETEATLIAQRLLNEAIMNGVIKNDILKMDGKFGDRTYDVARAFQRANGKLTIDGIVGPKTFEALGLIKGVDYPVRLRGQPTVMTCWSACTKMLNGGADKPPVLANKTPAGGLATGDANLRFYAADIGAKFNAAPITLGQFAVMLNRVPLWVGGLIKNHASGAAMHVVIYAGVFRYNFSGTEHVVKIFDPWPVGQGSKYFAKLMKPDLQNAGEFTPLWFLEPNVFVP